MSTYEVSVSASFRARHAVATPDGTMEPPHEHDWRVEAVFRADQLDDDGFVVDFLAVREALDAALAPLGGGDLNAVLDAPASAERVAEFVAAAIGGRCAGPYCVRVEEAPGCRAAFYPGGA
jgi:6-pyruvoyltetrahydropterin/6-carboxytetrahydropterin synthase